MVDLGNFVDGDVPRWDAGEDDLLGVDVVGAVVYHPDISGRSFERSVLKLSERAEARARNVLNAARPARNGLRVIDAETIAEADKTCEHVHGYDYLDHFMADTRELASVEIGAAAGRARHPGVKVSPERTSDGISIRPARSFATLDQLMRWEKGAKAVWRPSVRLEIRISLDGPLYLLEEACEDIRRSLSRCGPVCFFEEHARQARDAAMEAPSPVLLRIPGLDTA